MSDESKNYKLRFTDEVKYTYLNLASTRAFSKIANLLSILKSSPYLGRVYDPTYEARVPPFKCRVLFCLHYGIYYIVDEPSQVITVFAIEDQRRNPEQRFATFKYELFDFSYDEDS